MGAYLVKMQTTANNVDGDSIIHYAGDVVSDWELNDYIREQIDKGVPRYTQIFEKLTDKEAHNCRVKSTAAEGKRRGSSGQLIDPPWDDFIGLHPKEVVDRMNDLRPDDAVQVRQYEEAGMKRSTILEHVVPSEREPWHEYDNWAVRDILDKLSILDEKSVQDVITYEFNHKKRPAILEYDASEYEDSIDETSPSSEDGENGDDSGPIPAGVGASTEKP